MKRLMIKFLIFLCFVALLPIGLYLLGSILGIIVCVLNLLGVLGVGDFDLPDSKIEVIFFIILFSVNILVCVLLKKMLYVCIDRLEKWKNKLEESIKKKQKLKQKQKTRAGGYSGYSGGSYSGYSGYNRTLHDELDAVEYATRITDRYGQDWSGYNPEGPGLNPDPDSYSPSGYDPEAWNGPDITGL